MRSYFRVIYWLVGVAVFTLMLHSLWSNQDTIKTTVGTSQKWADDKYHSLRRENATLVTLARNNDLEKLLPSVRAVEDRWNYQFHYDWVFLNNEEFSDEFKEQISALVSGQVKFGLIEKKHWSYPEWIDQTKAAEERKKMHEQGIMYADNEQYRHMCRFESGFFFENELMKDYRYYWRVEPETDLLCDIDYDVFKYMRENNKKYGWTLSITEWPKTIPTLWNTTREFLDQHPEYIHNNALQNFVRDKDNREEYNMCHFWSNFEVADADFWRSKPYQEYFKHLDKAGGFFYERWGDAPVHSIAASLFMDRDELHFFDDIGYKHPPFAHCPAAQKQKNLRCHCMPEKSFDWHKSSCLRVYLEAFGEPFPADYREPFG
ncbi:alpha-1,2 mannosyltransferase Ktr1p [Trichomonascus vanleenenianus]|uniref:glycosyltransferase family 15 protein n=1 Tax=Trichomonascus vanleenenianus TaxID=2268995 RepID=UPI003ECAD1FB